VRHTLQTQQFIALQTVIAGRFSLEREIGRGGSAVVYLAQDVTLNRPVAIKLLNPDVAADQTIRQQFMREARTAGLLSQPNIVPIHAVEEHGDMVFFVMGYVDGETLSQWIMRRGMLEIGEATRMLRGVAWALGYAHARGITHRDVKPEHIMIERDGGRAIVTDFGIARHVDDPHGDEIVGTADYMSPEQAAGCPVDARSDIYSLGVTGFYAITGQLPFRAATDEQVLMLHETQPAPSVIELRAGVPGRLVGIIDRCLAKNPADRFATAEELAAALGDIAGAIRRVPAVVNNFLRVAQNTSRRLTVLAPLGGVLAYALGALSGVGIGQVILFFFVSWILVLELLVPPAALLAAARDVLVQGISYDEFCEILKVQVAEDSGTSTASGWRVRFVSSNKPLLLGASGVVPVNGGLPLSSS
jgi:serine/threonine-protein kinase